MPVAGSTQVLSIWIAPPVAACGVATHGAGAGELARALRSAGMRAVVQNRAPAGWGAWLRGAGLDGAIIGDQLIGIDDNSRSARPAIEAARAGDTTALIALLKAT